MLGGSLFVAIQKGQPPAGLALSIPLELLAEVPLEQALESLAVAGLVAGHLMHGVRRFAAEIPYLIYIF